MNATAAANSRASGLGDVKEKGKTIGTLTVDRAWHPWARRPGLTNGHAALQPANYRQTGDDLRTAVEGVVFPRWPARTQTRDPFALGLIFAGFPVVLERSKMSLSRLS